MPQIRDKALGKFRIEQVLRRATEPLGVDDVYEHPEVRECYVDRSGVYQQIKLLHAGLKLIRVPDPILGRRKWLYAWNAKADGAQSPHPSLIPGKTPHPWAAQTQSQVVPEGQGVSVPEGITKVVDAPGLKALKSVPEITVRADGAVVIVTDKFKLTIEL